MAQQLRRLTALPEDQSSVPRTHVRWPTAACNATSRGFNFWPSHAPAPTYTNLHKDTTYITTTNNNQLFKNVNEGQQDGSGGKGGYHRAWQLELDPWDSHGRRVESNLRSCPLTPLTCHHMHSVMHMPNRLSCSNTVNKINFKKLMSLTWEYTIIPGLWRQRQEDQELKVNWLHETLKTQ